MFKNHIAGDWVEGQDAARNINPSDTDDVIGEFVRGTAADVDQAVAAARAAFPAWSRSTPQHRHDILKRASDELFARAPELGRILSREEGKTLAEGVGEATRAAQVMGFFAGECLRAGGEALPSVRPGVGVEITREALGVVGLITPWNFPIAIPAWKIAPALGAGNTVVIKPSELTPLTTLHLARLLGELDLPPGVFNLVTGGAEVGAELAASLDVDLVSFTGGAAAGRHIMKAAADSNFKRVALELGGKNPNIVFADADLDIAVDRALDAAFFHAGQVCSAGSRLLVEDTVHEAFVERLAARMARIVIGSGLEAGTQMGPVQSAAQRARLMAMVEQAVSEGARVLTGGCAPQGESFRHGFWLAPTLVTGVTESMTIAREEIFGPVLAVERFSGETEALRLANGTPYGLAGAVWTRDLARAARMTRAMRFGTVWVNDYHPYFPEAPWGGFKASGIGRELARIGLDEYTELKHSYINLAPAASGWFGA